MKVRQRFWTCSWLMNFAIICKFCDHVPAVENGNKSTANSQSWLSPGRHDWEWTHRHQLEAHCTNQIQLHVFISPASSCDDGPSSSFWIMSLRALSTETPLIWVTRSEVAIVQRLSSCVKKSSCWLKNQVFTNTKTEKPTHCFQQHSFLSSN